MKDYMKQKKRAEDRPRVPKISVVPTTQLSQDSALADPQKTTFGFLTKFPILSSIQQF